jgi:hypothetical protein
MVDNQLVVSHISGKYIPYFVKSENLLSNGCTGWSGRHAQLEGGPIVQQSCVEEHVRARWVG